MLSVGVQSSIESFGVVHFETGPLQGALFLLSVIALLKGDFRRPRNGLASSAPARLPAERDFRLDRHVRHLALPAWLLLGKMK